MNSFPQVEVTQSDEKQVTLTLSTHGPVVSITSAMIKLAFAAMGAYLVSKAGLDLSNALTYLGSLLAGGAAGSLADTLNSSNKATKALLGAKE